MRFNSRKIEHDQKQSRKSAAEIDAAFGTFAIACAPRFYVDAHWHRAPQGSASRTVPNTLVAHAHLLGLHIALLPGLPNDVNGTRFGFIVNAGNVFTDYADSHQLRPSKKKHGNHH